MKFQKVNKILLFRLCCLGDVAMLTPVITNLHRAFPDAGIKIAASKWIKNMLPYLTYISDAIIFDAPFEKGFFKRLSGTIRFIFSLRKEKFDMVFVAHRSRIYGLILKLAGIRYRLGFEETPYMTHTAKYDAEAHFVDRHLNVLSENGIRISEKSLSLVPLQSKVQVRKQHGLAEKEIIIGIFPFGGSNPGTQMDIKRWEYQKYIELVKRFEFGPLGAKIIMFEGYLPGEIIIEEFKSSNILKLKMTNDLLSVCDIFVAGDTGPLYIAEGFGASTLSIFGPSDADNTAPKSTLPGTQHMLIWKKPYCCPCYTPATAFDRKNPKYWRGNTFVCWTGTHECIASISVEEVKTALDQMIEHVKR